MNTTNVGGTKVEIVVGNLTVQAVDAIVNAANSSLLGGGGVDGAIHRAGGPQILEECRAIVARQGRCKPGEAVITSAGQMPSRYVIHTVGPVWRGGESGESEILARCWTQSLALAVDNGCRTVAFPAISTGAYGYPMAAAAEVSLRAVAEVLRGREGSVDVVRVVVVTERDAEIWRGELGKLVDADRGLVPERD